jgi:hypothetical protein
LQQGSEESARQKATRRTDEKQKKIIARPASLHSLRTIIKGKTVPCPRTFSFRLAFPSFQINDTMAQALVDSAIASHKIMVRRRTEGEKRR